MAEDNTPASPRLSNRKNEPQENSLLRTDEPEAKPKADIGDLWESIVRLGLGEVAVRAATVTASIALALLVVWVMSGLYLNGRVTYERDAAPVRAAPLPTATATVEIPAYALDDVAYLYAGIPRLAQIHTILPNRPRFDIEMYTVVQGDTIIGIAEKYGLKPQTILWGNVDLLNDNPEFLQIGQSLRILPVNGVLHQWRAGEGLNAVSKAYGVTPEDIIQWPGNHLNPDTIGDYAHPNIAVGTLLVVPDGTRKFISWSAPLISRKDPASAKIFGPGFCGTITDGYIGSGAFVWPTVEHWLSGYDYTPDTNHWGIDIAGALGNDIYAADSGVVVYAGWNDWGYGNVLVIDHGNGWQTLYAHLSEFKVGCGASVMKGTVVALMGSTGRSSGPHLHFELMNASGVRVNPWNYLQK